MRATELLPLVLLFGAFWLLIIRPAQRQRANKAALLAALQPGAEVVTTGGLHGRVVAFDEEDVILEVAPDVRMRFVRGAIAAIKPVTDGADGDSGSREPNGASERSDSDVHDRDVHDRDGSGTEGRDQTT